MNASNGVAQTEMNLYGRCGRGRRGRGRPRRHIQLARRTQCDIDE